MKLVSIKLKNFRGYEEETHINFSDLTAFIGKNDAGKSTILEALEIFFNSSLVSCEQDDLNVRALDKQTEISCCFSDFDKDNIVVDSSASTSLASEYLLNKDHNLEIKKVFKMTASKPKAVTYIVCNHPTAKGFSNLLDLKRKELQESVKKLEIDANEYNANTNHTMRKAMWSKCEDLQLNLVDLEVGKEDAKDIYTSIERSLPLFALFQSDRSSKDDDKEVLDPMKLAIQQALGELEDELEKIKNQVKSKALETANRTLIKLQEMDEELASELIPEFKSDPKFDSQFKLSIRSEDSISMNKRGSGIRRLILLNFFRAEAERRQSENIKNQIIYAFEEPETSQHPKHQEMLIRSFLELSNSTNTQVILTTHTPALAAYLPLDSLRFVTRDSSNLKKRIVEENNEEVFKSISETLGVLPNPISKDIKAILLVEGQGDVVFINHSCNLLKENGHITHTLQEKGFAIIPVGGCGNLKAWNTMKFADQFGIPWCVFVDSDKGTAEEGKNVQSIKKIVSDTNVKAFLTKKREPENYIHIDCFKDYPGVIAYSETDDAKTIINQFTKIAKTEVLERFWVTMSFEQFREMETYEENGEKRFEITEVINEFLTIV